MRVCEPSSSGVLHGADIPTPLHVPVMVRQLLVKTDHVARSRGLVAEVTASWRQVDRTHPSPSSEVCEEAAGAEEVSAQKKRSAQKERSTRGRHGGGIEVLLRGRKDVRHAPQRELRPRSCPSRPLPSRSQAAPAPGLGQPDTSCKQGTCQ